MDLEDQSSGCDENVTRGERVVRRPGRQWDRSHVFFPAGNKSRNRREQRNIPIAVDLIDVLGAVFAHEQKIRRSGNACGKGERDKGSSGVKDSCER
jgi:hypothetical protein